MIKKNFLKILINLTNPNLLKLKAKDTLKIFILIIGVPILSLISITNLILPSRYKIRFSDFRSNRIAHYAMGYYVRYAQKSFLK